MVEKRGYLQAFFLFMILVVLFTSTASASFTLGNKSYSIDKAYGASEAIRGWVNISFSNEPSSSLFQDSGNRSVKLIDLLKNSSSSVYSCNPVDCSSDYNANNGAASKSLAIGDGSSNLIGLKFNGVISKIDSVNFSITSGAPASCQNQILVDFFDDGVTDLMNNKADISASCSNLKNYGCYYSGVPTEEYSISATPYCQRVNLSKSSGFSIGGWIKKNSGAMNIKASIFTLGGTEVANCGVASFTGEGEFSCNVDYPVTEPKEYYVCISSASGTGDYKIRGNSNPVKGCGFFGLPPPASSGTPASYQIFAEGKGFGAVGNLDIKNSVNGKKLSDLIYSYITRRYGTSDCTAGCVVPIRFSGLNQQVSLSGLIVTYQKTTGVAMENNFYDLSETSAKINSGFGNVYLNDAGFNVPNKLGTYKFSLKLNGNNLIAEEVNVSDVPRINSLSPISTASAYPTAFKVSVNSSKTISRFSWDFGDNTTGISTTGTINHIYNLSGNYKITVNATDSKMLSGSKSFDIRVISPAGLINATLVKMKDDIKNIETQIAGFDLFSQQGINYALKVENATKEITRIGTEFNSAQSEAEYNQIVSEILRLNALPRSVSEGKIANSVPFFSEKGNINLETIKKAGGGDYDADNQENYDNAILIWNFENLESSLTFREFFGNYDGDLKSVVKVFELNVKKKGDISGSYFLIMPKLENLKFESGVVASEYQGNVYVDLSKREKVSFYTTEDVDFTNLPAFISPAFTRLSLTDANAPIPGEAKPKWMIFILAIIFLLIIAFVVYLVLQEWYRRKYETYLFKNRNDLYNMVNYVHNSKKKGMKNHEIAGNLKKAKWNSEQITYVMKKYAGERTGMLEIPIFKFFRKKSGDENLGKNIQSNHKKL
jgi:hypothetical protein